MSDSAENIKGIRRFEISVIILFWVLLFTSPLIIGRSGDPVDWRNVSKIWIGHSFLLILFLLNRFILLPFIFFRKKQAFYVISVIVLMASAATGMYLVDRKPVRGPDQNPPPVRVQERRPRNGEVQPPPGPENGRPRQTERKQPEPVPAYINLLILSVLVFGFDTGLKITSRWVKSEQDRIDLQKQNIETQLAFLKHQISPRFFMNTLNNIHSLIDIDSVEAKKSIIKLSVLMRHLLYESDHERSPVRNEIDFIKSYVDLMKLRYSNEVKISLKVPENVPDKSIPPLIFISLLDNAFKHGMSYMRESFVDIEISIQNEKLRLDIINSKGSSPSDKSVSGIGIENTRKRLDLLYKDNYLLDLTDRGNVFITNLSIPL